MKRSTLPEVWLRGPLAGTPPLLQPVAHALLQAREEVLALMEGFPAEKLWDRPAGVASVGFHLQHLAGVLDRLLTYARGAQLNEQQLKQLAAEGSPHLAAEGSPDLETAPSAAEGSPDLETAAPAAEGSLDLQTQHPAFEGSPDLETAPSAAEGSPNPHAPTVQSLLARYVHQTDLALQQLSATPESTLTEVRGVGRAQIPSTVIGLLVHAAEHTQRHNGQLLVTVKFLYSSVR